MLRFLELFDSISVISLVERDDKRRALWKDFAKHFAKTEVERIEVFDGIRPADPGPFSLVGERGCFLSHLAVLENALDAGAETVLLIEDDAEFLPAFAEHVEWVTEELQRMPWDIVNFGWKCDSILFTDGQLASQPSFARSHAGVYESHFIAFRRPALEGIVAHLRSNLSGPVGDDLRGPMPVDGAYNTYCWLNPQTIRLFTIPLMVSQRRSRSDITPARLDTVPVLRPWLSWLRESGAIDKIRARGAAESS